MRSDAAITSTSRLALPTSDSPGARTGPVTVAVGQAVDSTLRAGALVAHQLGRAIAVISVLEPAAIYLWNLPSSPIPPTYEHDQSLARWSFLDRQMRAAVGDTPDWSVEVLWGGVPRTVARAAHELHAPCIVMGLGRHRPVDRLLGGETALRTVRHADCPVLAVPADFRAMPTTVVIGTDFSDSSGHALRAALPLLGPNPTLVFVHAWHPIGELDPTGTPYDADYRRELPRKIAQFVERLGLPRGMTVRTEAMEGRPADQLLAAAKAGHADLIVVGRHGRGAVERLFVGSVATRVLRGAECAVLVVPDPPPHERLQLAERLGAVRRPVDRAEWASFLDRFTRRFAGRLVGLDVNDGGQGLSTEERGSVLFGASFDPAENRLEIILGEPNGRRRQLTRSIPGPDTLTTLLSPTGEEVGLHVVHGTGETLLTIQPLAVHPAS